MRLLDGYRGIYTVFAIVGLLVIAVSWLPAEWGAIAIREGGPVELLTAIGLLSSALWLFIDGTKCQFIFGVSSGSLALLLGLRELDFHSRFTTMGIFKTKFYVSDKVPLNEKIIVTCLVIVLLVGFFWYVKKYLPRFIAAVKDKNAAALSLGIAISFAVFSKILDSTGGDLSDLLMPICKRDLSFFFKIAEEVLELGIAMFILLAIYKMVVIRSSD